MDCNCSLEIYMWVFVLLRQLYATQVVFILSFYIFSCKSEWFFWNIIFRERREIKGWIFCHISWVSAMRPIEKRNRKLLKICHFKHEMKCKWNKNENIKADSAFINLNTKIKFETEANWVIFCENIKVFSLHREILSAFPNPL